MPPPYRQPFWAGFLQQPFQPAGAIGFAPAQWAAQHQLAGIPAATIPLPGQPLDRGTVRDICRNPGYPVLFGYICAMAWGIQGVGPFGPPNVASAWTQRALIAQGLNQLRNGGLTRCAAYNLFRASGGNGNTIPGLGPSYFTKLLHFFSPNDDFYIMDKWTTQAVNVLTGTWLVPVTAQGGINASRCGNYQAYCEEVDSIGGLRGANGGLAEEMLWAWRGYNWPGDAPLGRYNRQAIRKIYPNIPFACF